MTRNHSEASVEPGRPLSLRHLAVTALTLGGVSCGAILLNSTAWGTGSISILWPSTGLLIGILLCLPRKQWPLYIALGFVTDLLVNWSLPTHIPLGGMLYLAGCNVVEVSLAAWLLKPTLTPQPYLTRPGQLIRFLGYGVVLAPAIASLLASCCLSGSFGKPTLHSFQLWFTADALGISIVTPLYLGLRRRAPFSNRAWYEVVLLFVSLCAISFLVFWQTSLPILFVIFPLLLLVEVRLGLAGSAIGLLAISIIGGYSTAIGHGPIGLTHFTSLSLRTLTMQFFAFVCMMVVYIMEVVLAERNRLEFNLSASELRFRLLAEGSHDIIMLQDLERTRQYVSPAAEKLLGWAPHEFLPMDCRQLLHPDDFAGVQALYDECLAGKAFNTMDYRFKKRDGGYLWLEANLVLHRDAETDAAAGFINVLRDISSRKAAEDELNRALGLAESLASIDGLTGVANRRSFDEFFQGEWLRAIRARAPISLLMIDVDHFKRYNDTYGHVSGDNCLRLIVEAIGTCIHRPTDLLARYGGEEFVVVLPNTDANGAESIAEQIRTTLEMRQVPHRDNPHGVVTVSIGCATQTPKPRSLSTELVEIADEALYRAKSAGRNCIVLQQSHGVEGVVSNTGNPSLSIHPRQSV
jgi:diguanylate cyclase (GGDEF)-like protein/PAS domain S-box-containing protein